MTNTIRTMALASLLLAAPVIRADDLMDIYQRALQSDPAVREAEATYLAAAEAKPQARSSILPGLSLSGAKSHRYQESSSPAVIQGSGQSIGVGTQFVSDSTQWNISLTQTLYNMQQFTQLKQADKRVMKAETDYEAAKQDLLIRVANAYFNVLAAEDSLASAVAARESVARQLEQAQRRFDVGLIAITDVQQSQAGYDDAVATEIEAQRVVATNHEMLREIIGEIVTDLAAPKNDLPLLTPDPANAEQWVQMALAQNLSLVSSRINADIAQDDIQIQRAARLPTLSLSAGYSESSTNQVYTIFNPPPAGTIRNPSTSAPNGYNWELDVRVPIFTGGLNRSRIQQSVYTQRAASETLERIARQTERQARDSYLGVISKISQVRALRQSVESNRTALRATQAGFEVGTQTTVDVLQSQNNLSKAETSYSRSRYDYIMDVLLLKQAAGTLSVDDVQQVNGWLEEQQNAPGAAAPTQGAAPPAPAAPQPQTP
jgi:outer membrane protein